MVKHAKPKTFYDTFERRGPGEKNTTYCPGCGHGNAHKLIAEVIAELNIQDRVIFCSPVGCSVFAYYYFDTGNVQCSHGRAPAVATGLSRTRENAVIISYQGDGDLAGIGMGAIMHAANRGEHMAVFFINNAIYGMTGGQMAPTTLIGQKTLTTPFGRSPEREGYPIRMCELINELQAPVYIERVSLGDAARIMRAKRAVKQAILNQVNKKGFSFVEILSPCPVNWKMAPMEARRWLIDKMEPLFPVKVFRNIEEPPIKFEPYQPISDVKLVDLFSGTREIEPPSAQKKVEDQYIKIAGFGGQGVMSAGVLLANCAIKEGLNATWLPSYGPEMRGGTANASVIISNNQIGAPGVDSPNVFIAMNAPSLDMFEDSIVPQGLVIVNTSLVPRKLRRDDVRAVYAPVTEIAKDAGLIAAASVVALTLYACISGAVELETLKKVIPISLKKKSLVDLNLKVVDAAVEYYKKNLKEQYSYSANV
ncbi:MAG TPA: 2-oxoacid:acceptor oxidoreductase family protein [Spirochaetales bacterium]|nr:2-oxoacid:acceptor oxidoreductase family protein [Spirochaetales bacterium]